MDVKKFNGTSWETTPSYVYKTATDTLSLPATIYADGTAATIGLKGNTVQNGTPTPDSPIMPQGCGDMSAQLIPYPFYSSDGGYAGVKFTTDNGRIIANGTLTSGLLYYLWRPANFQAGTYTMSVKGKHSGATIYFRDTTHNVTVASISGTQEVNKSVTFTVTEEIGAMVYINVGSGQIDFDCTIMLNAGEEALPFEPTNGYKIPISLNSTTTNIYIGDEPLRKSLDGTAVDELAADGTLTRRVDSDGSVLATPVVTQITMPTFLTTDGANTVSVDTTVQPSEMTMTYHGWHNGAVHERESGQWNE